MFLGRSSLVTFLSSFVSFSSRMLMSSSLPLGSFVASIPGWKTSVSSFLHSPGKPGSVVRTSQRSWLAGLPRIGGFATSPLFWPADYRPFWPSAASEHAFGMPGYARETFGFMGAKLRLFGQLLGLMLRPNEGQKDGFFKTFIGKSSINLDSNHISCFGQMFTIHLPKTLRFLLKKIFWKWANSSTNYYKMLPKNLGEISNFWKQEKGEKVEEDCHFIEKFTSLKTSLNLENIANNLQYFHLFWKVEEQNFDKSHIQSGFSCTGVRDPPYDGNKLVVLIKIVEKDEYFTMTSHYFGTKKITSRQIIWGLNCHKLGLRIGGIMAIFGAQIWSDLGLIRDQFITQICSFKRGNFSSFGNRITPFHHNFRPENDVFINFVPSTFGMEMLAMKGRV